MFIPGVSEASIDGNSRWDAGELTARQSDCDAFLAALAVDDCLACVFHDESLGAVTPTLITSLQVQSLLATQRRRLRR